MARHFKHGIIGSLATSVAKVPERWKHSIKQHRCYNKYITIFDPLSIFLFQVIRGMHVSPAKHSFGKCDRKV